ncbi:MAG: NADH pyrophosphatase [Chrysothrix sp. TS-e1954]|nr:MAG: NADH pyrophosphatase [Chrysothrix sp. TS-e1954]
MSTESPQLPEPAHADLDSMLTRKFGREVANYFSGSPLNRVSFLRSDHKFLTSALHHPTTRFLLFRSLSPLVHSPSSLSWHGFSEIQPLVGENPFEKTEADMIADYDSRTTIPQMIFLGLEEDEAKGKDGEFSWKQGEYKGAPVWAVDVTPKGTVAGQAEKIVKDVESKGLSFMEGRMILSLPATEAAIYAQARHLLDWNARNPFCAGCGQPTMSVNAGGKRVCPEMDRSPLKGNVASHPSQENSASPNERPPCATRKGVSNLSFPRTDPTVIMAVVSSDSKRILLGRQKRWPPNWYSTLAGFCEPAESIEEAVRREVWEEAGVKLGRVIIHSSQPWPYPANLMIGAIGQTIPEAEKIDLGNDPELDDARWVGVEEMREALRVGTSGLGEPAGPEYKEGGLRLPPPTAIANRLMESFANSSLLAGDTKM